MATIPSAGTKVLNAVTVTSSAIVNVENFDSITAQFTCTGHASGNGVLTLLASNDGANFYGIAFVDLASTTTTTSVTSITLSSNTTSVAALPFAGFKFLKVNVAVTTDGSYTVWLAGNIRR